MSHRWIFVLTGTAALLIADAPFSLAQTPTPEFALQYRPAQKDVSYDSPTVADVKRCKVELERGKKASGFAVFDPNGQILRRYVDTNMDQYIDQWRYYERGIEVYRDIDSNFNKKIDQSRWLNTQGSRWALDFNEDGKVDGWRRLSAEETSRVAINAMAAGDSDLLATVMVTQKDLSDLGVDADLAGKVLANVRNPAASMRAAMSNSKTLTDKSRWHRFDAAMPGVIPADAGKATGDLVVYESTMAIVETGSQHGFVTIGEMLKVGDVWKLTQVPKPNDGNTIEVASAGILMSPGGGSAPSAMQGLSPEMQKLIAELQGIDKNPPAQNATSSVVQTYLQRRNSVLERIAVASRGSSNHDTWLSQLIDGLASALRSGDSAAGARLATLRNDIRTRSPNGPLLAHLDYRRLFADYSLRMQRAKPQEQQKIQDSLYATLEGYINEFPKSEYAADAMLQLAMNSEFTGKTADATRWYQQVSRRFSSLPAGVRAAGALRRLNLKGKPLELSGPDAQGRTVDVKDYRGRVLLVVYWATWSGQFTTDMPVLKTLYDQYRERGLAVVGVNLDQDAATMTKFAGDNRMNWKNIHQPGALDSPAAQQFGILTVPTMFLVDQSGSVISNGLTMTDLQARLAEIFKTAKQARAD